MKLFKAASYVCAAFTAFVVNATDMQGVTPNPIGKTKEAVTQLQIRFPQAVVKVDNAFAVNCAPATQGNGSWADNDTLWTYNFKSDVEWEQPRLPGGASCEVTQIADLKSVEGTVWPAGTIKYSVTIAGPNVEAVLPASGFNDSLREREPVVLVIFDGAIDRTKFFANQSGYISYTSGNAPAEKIGLSPIPDDQLEKVFSYFKATQYIYDVKYQDKNWVLATVRRDLIPGSELSLNISGVVSGYNPSVVSEEQHSTEFKVRSSFRAEIRCVNASTMGATCLPQTPITVAFNGKVKWADVKGSYIEYIPYKSQNGSVVKAYPVLRDEEGNERGWMDRAIDFASQYVPYFSRFSETLVESITFEIEAEPETQAKVVLASGIRDIDGRGLANALTDFYLRIGAMTELIRMPQPVSFFEKNIGRADLSMPVAIVNLNQKISVRKTGTDSTQWTPVQDIPTIISLIRAYAVRGDYRDTPEYTSPLVEMNIPSTRVDSMMAGEKNRATFLQFPFKASVGQPGGFYAMEVSSPTYEALKSNATNNTYFNPRYTLAMVTDLSVHVKRGSNKSMLWVTRLSNGMPVAGATVDIYNCLGERKKTVSADGSGLVTINNERWAASCNASNRYSDYADESSFFAIARTADDFTLTHSSWVSTRSYAFNAPGVEYFYSSISDERPYYHAILGVNLVKPGQKVPVEILAKLPYSRGFGEVPAAQRPVKARIESSEDADVYYEFDLTWNGNSAKFEWTVPADSSVKLGQYDIQLMAASEEYNTYANTMGGIEVAEFKIPLMTGLLSFPTQALVQPTAIPVNGVIRYANGVGAKDVAVEMSYYFEPTSVEFKGFEGFNFGSGIVSLDVQEEEMRELPSSTRPEVIAGLTTNQDGAIARDLGAERLASGKTVADAVRSTGRPQRLVTRLRYQDQMGEFQTLSQGKDIYNSRQYVGTKVIAGERAKAKLQAAAVNVDGQNVLGQAALDLRLFEVATKVIGEEIYGGLIKNTVERQLNPIVWNNNCATQKGILSCAVGNLKAGSYAFQATSATFGQSAFLIFKVDANGNVYNEQDYYYYGDPDEKKQLPLALNKETYRGGERAVVSFAAPYKTCAALVTIERNDVIEGFVVNNACERGSVEVPVDASLAPNAFVSVYAISGRVSTPEGRQQLSLGDLDLGRPSYRLGFANIKVDWAKYKALVDVRTDKPKYEPGQTVNVEVAVRPEEGQMGASKVTLVAIEEKILSLKDNETYKILQSLMQLRGHGVVTVTPLDRVETVTAKAGSADNALGASERKGGDEGGDGGSAAEMRRKLFDALVSFQPDVNVVDGVARFNFKANDSLTKFKIFAIAVSANNKFGTGEVTYISEKDTQAYSNIPSVAYTGDQYPLRVTIQNNSAKDLVYRAEITAVIKDASGKVIGTKKLDKSVAIGRSNSVAADVGEFAIPEDAARVEYVVNIYDEQGNLVDSMQPDAQVILPAIPLAIHHSYIKQVQNGSLSIQLNKEAASLQNKGEIRVALANSLVNGAVAQISKRLDGDKFADFFPESRVYKAMLQGSKAKPEALREALNAMLNQIDSSGFVKYSPRSEHGDVWLTAAIINILQTEKWAMDQVPAALAKQWKNAISKVLTKTAEPKYVPDMPIAWMNAQAVMGVAAFAFDDVTLQDAARAASQDITTQLATNPLAYGYTMDKWTNGAVVDLLMLQAYTQPQTALQSPAFKLLADPSRLVYSGNAAVLIGKPTWWLEALYSDETIETARMLYAYSKLQGGADLARAIAVGIVNASDKQWYSTRTIAWASQGLKQFGQAYETEAVGGRSTVEFVEQRTTQDVNWSATQAIVNVATLWTAPQETVRVNHNGSGAPWLAVQGLTATPLTAPRGQGMTVEKEIRNVNRAAGFKAGDMIEVTLKINASSRLAHIALLDPIPAGANILGEAYGFFSSGEKSYKGYKLYFEWLPQGLTTVKYQYQLNNPGSFKLPPTRAEGLYMPSVFGEAPNASMTVE